MDSDPILPHTPNGTSPCGGGWEAEPRTRTSRWSISVSATSRRVAPPPPSFASRWRDKLRLPPHQGGGGGWWIWLNRTPHTRTAPPLWGRLGEEPRTRTSRRFARERPRSLPVGSRRPAHARPCRRRRGASGGGTRVRGHRWRATAPGNSKRSARYCRQD